MLCQKQLNSMETAKNGIEHAIIAEQLCQKSDYSIWITLVTSQNRGSGRVGLFICWKIASNHCGDSLTEGACWDRDSPKLTGKHPYSSLETAIDGELCVLKSLAWTKGRENDILGMWMSIAAWVPLKIPLAQIRLTKTGDPRISPLFSWNIIVASK